MIQQSNTKHVVYGLRDYTWKKNENLHMMPEFYFRFYIGKSLQTERWIQSNNKLNIYEKNNLLIAKRLVKTYRI